MALKRGRPPLQPEERRSAKLLVRVTEAELAATRLAAWRAGNSVSAWVRNVLLNAARE